MRIVIPEVQLHAGQRLIFDDPRRFKVVAAGRRFGKTRLSEEWLGFAPGGAIDGASVGYFAPSYKVATEVWAELRRNLRPVTERASKTEMRIETITGGVVDFWTLDNPDAGRGRRYHRIVIDEAAHARYLREAWERSIAPTLTDFRGSAWFISTPRGLNYFHTLHQRGGDPAWPEWASFSMASTVNPYIPAEEVEQWRASLPELVFRQEYLAEFVTFGAGLVRPDMIALGPAPAGLAVVLAVDLAISSKATADWTVILAMGVDRASGIVHVLEVERFRGEFSEIIRRIQAAAARHSPTVIAIEEVQFQAAVVQELLRTTRLPVRGVRPDKDKLTRFLPLLTRYERGMVRHDPAGVPAWFAEELLSFPDGHSDDGVDAASLAFRTAATPSTPAFAARSRTF